jgi:DNA polymerase-3 subunit alpha
LCGIITEVQHRTNQKGEGYGSFTLQDYHGSITMYLYKEQYRNHKNLLEVGTTLMVEGTYELDTWRQSDEWKFRIQTIMLLSSTLEYITKKMSLYLNIAHLSDETIRRIDQTCKKNKGHQILKFVVLDTEQEISLTFVGLKKKVNVCNELLADLEDIGLHYKLN